MSVQCMVYNNSQLEVEAKVSYKVKVHFPEIKLNILAELEKIG